MKFFYVLASAFLIVASSSKQVEAGAAPDERSSWYYPFWPRQGCYGCAAQGNVLPWCVRVPAQNLLCTSIKAVALPGCVRIAGSQVVASFASAKMASALSPSATVSAAQCSAALTIPFPLIALKAFKRVYSLIVPYLHLFPSVLITFLALYLIPHLLLVHK